MVEKSENSRKKRPDEGRKMENWKVLEKGGVKRSGRESGDASLPDSCFFILGAGDVRAAALRHA